MSDARFDPRRPVDPAINSPGREGLTGTAPASLYAPTLERDQITVAPDFAPADAQPAWRQDFPIDWPQDLYVERRDFMKFLVLTSAAFTLGQVSIGIQNWYRKRSGQPPMQRIASIDELAVGGSVGFTYPDDHEPCLLVRLTASEFVAFSQKCTHLSCAVIPRPAEGSFYCPCHEGRFDLRTGAPTGGPPRRPLSADRPRHPGPGHLCGRDRGADDMNTSSKRPFSRDQRTTIVYGMLVFVLIVVVLQLWLLTATMNAWLGGDDAVVWPAAAVSAAGLALNVGLLKYLGRIGRTRSAGV